MSPQCCGGRECARPPRQGNGHHPEALAPVVEFLTQALEQAAGLRPGRDKLDALLTEGTRWEPPDRPPVCSFSGGVADCIYTPKGTGAPMAISACAGRAIRESPGSAGHSCAPGTETIRATVVGAGSHSTELSGSTIFYRNAVFPLKNLPILKLTEAEERGSAQALEQAIGAKLRWFADEGGLSQLALGLRERKTPAIPVCGSWPRACTGLEPLRRRGCKRGRGRAGHGQGAGPDHGAPAGGTCFVPGRRGGGQRRLHRHRRAVANGAVLPVIIKTLVFNK